jgi:hypothetical protein
MARRAGFLSAAGVFIATLIACVFTQQNGEQMGTAKIAIEMAHDGGLAQARNVERMANSALMLNPDYLAGMERYIQGIGGKGKEKE